VTQAAASVRSEALPRVPVDSAAITEGVDRTLSQVASAVWLILVLGFASRDFRGIGEYAPWWLALSALALVLVLLNLALGRILPMTVLRIIWVVVPLLGFVRMTLAGLAYGSGPGWSGFDQGYWITASMFAVYLIFWMPTGAAVAVVLVAGFLPVLSNFLAAGEVPYETWVSVPIYMVFFAFVAIFSVRRDLMLRFRTVEAEAQAEEAHRIRVAAEAEQHAKFVRLVHDEVLASLSAAVRFEGVPPDAVRAQATRALSVLERQAPSSGPRVPCHEVRSRLIDLALQLDPACVLDIRCSEDDVAAQPADTLLAAAGEALRNSLRHAGQVARRFVYAELAPDAIRIEVEDDGAGFDPETIAADRIGVRRSILGAVEELEGASAEIFSMPDLGTRVVLRWRG